MSRYGVNFHATLDPSNCVAQTQDAPSLSRPDWTIGGGFKLAAELPYLVHCVVRGKRVSETRIRRDKRLRYPRLQKRAFRNLVDEEVGLSKLFYKLNYKFHDE